MKYDGGIILALTWGLVHIFSKGSIAVGILGAAGVKVLRHMQELRRGKKSNGD